MRWLPLLVAAACAPGTSDTSGGLDLPGGEVPDGDELSLGGLDTGLDVEERWTGTFSLIDVLPAIDNPRCNGTAVLEIGTMPEAPVQAVRASFLCDTWTPNLPKLGEDPLQYGFLSGVGFGDAAMAGATTLTVSFGGENLARRDADATLTFDAGEATLTYDDVEGSIPALQEGWRLRGTLALEE